MGGREGGLSEPPEPPLDPPLDRKRVKAPTKNQNVVYFNVLVEVLILHRYDILYGTGIRLESDSKVCAYFLGAQSVN